MTDIDTSREAVEALAAENARLRAALEPFAKYASAVLDELKEHGFSSREGADWSVGRIVTITVQDILNARAALDKEPTP
jgi:hypothetical protein